MRADWLLAHPQPELPPSRPHPVFIRAFPKYQGAPLLERARCGTRRRVHRRRAHARAAAPRRRRGAGVAPRHTSRERGRGWRRGGGRGAADVYRAGACVRSVGLRRAARPGTGRHLRPHRPRRVRVWNRDRGVLQPVRALVRVVAQVLVARQPRRQRGRRRAVLVLLVIGRHTPPSAARGGRQQRRHRPPRGFVARRARCH